MEDDGADVGRAEVQLRLFLHAVAGNADHLIKIISRANGVDHLFREGDPDNYVSGHYILNWMVFFDPKTGEVTVEHFAGTPWNIHLPGQGSVYHLSGTVFYDENGDLVKDVGLRVEDFVALCEYFAP